MRLIAHRGCADRGPENTLRAVTQAAPHVDGVEIDVRRCGSGELVVVHDASLDRLTGSAAAVSETSLAALRGQRVLGSDQHVPRLADVVDSLPTGVELTVELKERGLARDIEAVVAEHPSVVVSSFHAEELAGTSLPRAYVFEEAWERSVDAAARLDCAAVHPRYDLVLDRPERVAAAHERGFDVVVWTPPPSAVPDLRAVGVDGAMVDDWAVEPSAGSASD
jgi:glycerophosphoryl diester phosphodiesterase